MSAETHLKIIVGVGFDENITKVFSKNMLQFHKKQSMLREVMYQADASMLLLKAEDEENFLFIKSIRRDRYLELIPIVIFSMTRLSVEKKQEYLNAGINDFVCLDDPEIEISKRRVISLAALYWKLKKENSTSHVEEINRSVAFLDSLIENLPNMIFVKDAKELRFVRFNRAGEKLLGYKREDLMGKNDYDFFPKDQADHFTSKDRAVISSGQLLDIFEEPIHTREGLKILRTKKIPLYDEKGNPSFLLGISEDITELKKAELERIQLVKEQSARIEAEKGIQIRDEFISLASHELKTPLTSINLQFQLIKRWLGKKDFSDTALLRLEKIFSDSSYQLNRLANLLDDLLDVSRIQAGRFTYNFEKKDISTIIKNSVERFLPQLNAANCELRWGVLQECICSVDISKFEQCITNLLTNALKYSAGKPVEISLQREDQNAIFKIKDQGIGIDPQYHEKIFQRFERAVSSGNYSGLGLGLYISKEIIEAHKGKINVESALNEGSTFTVIIPLI